MLILTLLLFTSPRVEHTQLELRGLPQLVSGNILVDSKNNVWVTDYSDHIVVKFDSKGNFLFQLGRPGHGPGEIYKPSALVLLDNENTIVVSSNQGQTQFFNANTGEYLNKKLPFTFMFQAFPWKNDQIFLPFCTLPGKQTVNHIIDKSGTLIESWHSKAWVESYLINKTSTGAFQTAFLASDKTVYFADPYYPIILYQKKNESQPKEWSLKQPKGFQEIPPPLPFEARFNPKKQGKWYATFSKLFIYALGEKYVAASWLNEDFAPNILQIYDIHTKEIVINNVETANYIAYTNKNKLYCTEIRETDGAEEISTLILHTYAFVE